MSTSTGLVDYQLAQDLDDFSFFSRVDHVDTFVSRLTNYNVLVMDNNEPDVQNIEIQHDVELSMLIQSQFGVDPFQSIVTNMDVETKDVCPYFRVVMDGFGGSSTINFKLRAFFQKIGIPAMNARCKRAMVIGLHAMNQLDSPMFIPSWFVTTTIEPLSVWIGDIDMACLNTFGDKLIKPEPTSISKIAGMVIPYYVPEEVQWNILSYCQSPTAAIIEQQIDKICIAWDIVMLKMFQEREPRIPPHIALAYNASTVQQTVIDATRGILAPPALGRRSTV